MSKLRITEIFHSLQGESATVGWRTVFVRLTGCPLRCGYCDTTYAFKGGEWIDIPTILDAVASYQARHVTVTGGEPLAQADCLLLLTALCDAGYQVSLETSGALDVAGRDEGVALGADDAALAAVAAGGLAGSPADLASRCDVIVICVSDTPDVVEVIAGEGGVLRLPEPHILDDTAVVPGVVGSTRPVTEESTNRQAPTGGVIREMFSASTIIKMASIIRPVITSRLREPAIRSESAPQKVPPRIIPILRSRMMLPVARAENPMTSSRNGPAHSAWKEAAVPYRTKVPSEMIQ